MISSVDIPFLTLLPLLPRPILACLINIYLLKRRQIDHTDVWLLDSSVLCWCNSHYEYRGFNLLILTLRLLGCIQSIIHNSHFYLSAAAGGSVCAIRTSRACLSSTNLHSHRVTTDQSRPLIVDNDVKASAIKLVSLNLWQMSFWHESEEGKEREQRLTFQGSCDSQTRSHWEKEDVSPSY